jgi:hypothetical protein
MSTGQTKLEAQKVDHVLPGRHPGLDWFSIDRHGHVNLVAE